MDMPNAFATGRNADHAVVCVTTGLLRRLEPAELEGVLAHELSHVAHKDVAVITIASFLGVIAGLIVRFAFYSQLFGGGRRDQNTAVVFVAVMGVSAAVYAISFLLIRALSRYRELAADRAAALLTGRPSALASALTKVTGDIARIPTKDLRTAQAFNAFYFTPALGKEPGLARSSPPTQPGAAARPTGADLRPSWARRRLRREERGSSRSARLGCLYGVAGHPAGAHEARRARSRPALRAAVGGGDPAGGGRVHARPGRGAVCFATVEGAAFDRRTREVQALLDADAERAGPPVELVRDEYGYSWLVSRRAPEESAGAGQGSARGEQCDGGSAGSGRSCCVRWSGSRMRSEGGCGGSALVYLYKRGTFYPFAPLAESEGGGQRRDSALELQVRAALAGDLRIEQDLGRWFPVWGAPGL